MEKEMKAKEQSDKKRRKEEAETGSWLRKEKARKSAQ